MSPRSRVLRSLARRACFALALLGSASMLGCGQQLDVGSDVLWTARFESGDLSEWMTVSGGGAAAFPAPNVVDVSNGQVRRGQNTPRVGIPTTRGGRAAKP